MIKIFKIQWLIPYLFIVVDFEVVASFLTLGIKSFFTTSMGHVFLSLFTCFFTTCVSLQERRWRWRSFVLKGISCKNKVIIFRFFCIVLFYYSWRFCKWLLCYCSSSSLFRKNYKCNNGWVWGGGEIVVQFIMGWTNNVLQIGFVQIYLMCTKINILSNEHQIFKYKNTNVIIL